MSNSSLAIPLSPVCPSVENAGRSAPIGATVVAGGVNFSIFSRYATAVELLFFDRDDDARPARVIPFDSAANRTYHYWHAFVPGAQPGQLYGYRVYGPFDPPRGLRFDPGKVLLDPYGRSVVVPRRLQPRSRARRRRQRLHRDEERRSRSACVRLGGRYAALPASHPHRHLRDARARFHPPSQLRTAREHTRDLCRRVEKIPYLTELGVTAVELMPVFQFDAQDAPPGSPQLLGIRAGLVLRAAPGLQFAPRPARPCERVPRHGQGAAPRRHRSDSRRGLQSHRGRRSSRTHAVFSRPGQRRLLHPGAGPVALRKLHRHRQHAQCQRPHRPPHDCGQPPLLGGGNARRRIPLRPRLDSGARFLGAPDGPPAGALGHRIRRRARRHEVHRRSLGRRRTLSGGQLRRR